MGQLDEAKKVYSDAQLEEKNLGYHEPPMYIRPVGETEAAVLMRAKDYAGAKAAYEEALEGAAELGVWVVWVGCKVKEAQGDAAGARERLCGVPEGMGECRYDAATGGACAKRVMSGESLAEK